jgi:hypothetical protein
MAIVHSASSITSHHLRRPALHECPETVERLREIASDDGEAQAEMRGHIEAIAWCYQDPMLGGGLPEPAVARSAHQPGERGPDRPGARGEIEFYVPFVLVEPSVEQEGLELHAGTSGKDSASQGPDDF